MAETYKPIIDFLTMNLVEFGAGILGGCMTYFSELGDIMRTSQFYDRPENYTREKISEIEPSAWNPLVLSMLGFDALQFMAHSLLGSISLNRIVIGDLGYVAGAYLTRKRLHERYKDIMERSATGYNGIDIDDAQEEPLEYA